MEALEKRTRDRINEAKTRARPGLMPNSSRDYNKPPKGRCPLPDDGEESLLPYLHCLVFLLRAEGRAGMEQIQLLSDVLLRQEGGERQHGADKLC